MNSAQTRFERGLFWRGGSNSPRTRLKPALFGGRRVEFGSSRVCTAIAAAIAGSLGKGLKLELGLFAGGAARIFFELRPNSAQGAPRWRPDAPQIAQGTQGCSKMAPSRPQDSPRCESEYVTLTKAWPLYARTLQVLKMSVSPRREHNFFQKVSVSPRREHRFELHRKGHKSEPPALEPAAPMQFFPSDFTPRR